MTLSLLIWEYKPLLICLMNAWPINCQFMMSCRAAIGPTFVKRKMSNDRALLDHLVDRAALIAELKKQDFDMAGLTQAAAAE